MTNTIFATVTDDPRSVRATGCRPRRRCRPDSLSVNDVNGAKEAIRFAIGASSLGAMLVASSNKGVVAILLDDHPETLIRQLQDRFPKARFVGANESAHAGVGA